MTVTALDNLVDDIDNLTDPDGGTVGQPDLGPDPQPQQSGAMQGREAVNDGGGAEAQPQQGSEPQHQQLEPPEDDLAPPIHWSDEDKAVFENQTPEARRFLLERHRAMEGDYTRKSQYVSDQMRAVAGLQGLAVHLQQDPNFRQHLQNYFTAKAQPEGQEPEELSPVDKLKQEAADLAYKRIRREAEFQASQNSQLDYQHKMQSVLAMKQQDRLADKVQARLDKYVADQPLEWQREQALKTLSSNPDVYMQMYQYYRQQIQQEQGGDNDWVDPRAGNNVVRLERGGSDRRPTQNEARRKHLSKLKHKALASGETEALANFLDEAGVIDSLL